MCGIAGMVGIADEALLKEMLATIRHRGPNDSGTFVSCDVSSHQAMAFGNNRLSIIDLSAAGHQPMSTEDGSVHVVHNGEIFNFVDLRNELRRDGHQFRSQTDTEVLPHLYEKYGNDMVSRLEGMFATAVWDSRTKKLLLFRDRTGIKPLYYSQRGGRLYFASEIKALLIVPEVQPELHEPALESYLRLLYVTSSQTLFKGIFLLPPGHLLEWRAGNVSVHQYWDMTFSPSGKSEKDFASEIRETLFSCTQRQLVSDVPVGFFLSGGLDSSALLACAAQSHQSLDAYCIRYRKRDAELEQSSEDPDFAKLVANKFGARFHEVEVEPNVAQLLPKVIWHLDQPVADPAAIATYLICERAKKEVTVLLSGQGADELWGGYRVHLSGRLARQLRRLPRVARKTLGGPLVAKLELLLQRLPRPGLPLAIARYVRRLLSGAELTENEQYVFMRSYLTKQELNTLRVGGDHHPAGDLDDTLHALLDSPSIEDFVHRMLYFDLKTFLPDLNLAYTDKLSMASSIEVRVPFLDEQMLRLASTVPSSMKIRGLTGKHILRQALTGLLPSSVLQRRKAGFGLPIRRWLRTDLREMVTDLLSLKRVRERGIFDPQAVSAMVEANDRGAKDYTYQIWALLSLEIWQQAFLDGRHRIHRVPDLQYSMAGSTS